MNLFSKRRTICKDVRGGIPIGMLFFIALLAAGIWFLKTSKAHLPSMPNIEQSQTQQQQSQKLPPAAGVEFSTEIQTPQHQAQKYYKGAN